MKKKSVLYFLVYPNGDRKSVVKRRNEYCFEVQVDGIRLYPKIHQQPSEENILKVYRNYNSLRANPSYRRKITWIESYSISCIEYKGIFPGAKPHGNSKQKLKPT